MFIDYIEYFSKSWCPKCKSVSYIYNHRHPADETAFIEDAVRCWSCKQVYWLGEKEDFEITYEQEIEDAKEENPDITLEELISEVAYIANGKKGLGK